MVRQRSIERNDFEIDSETLQSHEKPSCLGQAGRQDYVYAHVLCDVCCRQHCKRRCCCEGEGMEKGINGIDGMKIYYQNGTVTDIGNKLSIDKFSVLVTHIDQRVVMTYTGDSLVRNVEDELVHLFEKFSNLYFPDANLYYGGLSIIPKGILDGGQSSDSSIDKNKFIELIDKLESSAIDIYRHIYVGDCQYLVSTLQNLIQAIEYCFMQYYIQIAQIDIPEDLLVETKLWNEWEEYITSSHQSRQLIFYLETFFTKLYSILDIMVKIVYELENPTESFTSITKLRSTRMLWGDRKKIAINNSLNSIFEDCNTIRMIESLRNEAVHNGSWEYQPKVYIITENRKIVERYMLFPDFEEGALSTVKNRRHFFSTGAKVNDVLLSIHNDFYKRLLITLQQINSTF